MSITKTGEEEFFFQPKSRFTKKYFVPIAFNHTEWRLYITQLKNINAFSVVVFASMGILLFFY